MISTMNKLFLALVLISSFSLYCSKEKGGSGSGGVCISGKDGKGGGWHSCNGDVCGKKNGNSGCSGNGSAKGNAEAGASGMKAYQGMVSAAACGAGTKTDEDVVHAALAGAFGVEAAVAAIAAGGKACPANAALAVKQVHPNIQITTDGKIIGHDIFIGKDGTLCTRADLAKSLIAIVNLEELGNPVIQQTIAKIKIEYFANDHKLFACAAENIVGKCLFPNASHTCYKSYPPVQALSKKDDDAHTFILKLMRERGCA